MDPTNIETSLQYGVCLSTRRVFLHGDLDEASVGIAIRALHFFEAKSPTSAQLILSSCGGDLDEAFGLHDTIQSLDIDIEVRAIGKCMSAAPLLLACGRQGWRTAGENTQFMLHAASLEMPDTSLKGAQAAVTATKKKMDQYAEMLALYTCKDEAHWKRRLQSSTDRYFDAEEALEWGLIDSIWKSL